MSQSMTCVTEKKRNFEKMIIMVLNQKVQIVGQDRMNEMSNESTKT